MEDKQQKSKEEFWNAHITRFNQSGLSRRQYCLTENLSYWTFREWLKKNETSADAKLVKIPRSVHPHEDNRQSSIEIILAEKICIRVAQGFDGELLREVVCELGIGL